MTNKRPYKHPQVNLRIPQELKDKVEVAADESGRSMNAEIVHRLTQSFKTEHNQFTEEMRRVLDNTAAKIIATLAAPKKTSPDK